MQDSSNVNNTTELKTDTDYIDFQRDDINNALYFDLKEAFPSQSNPDELTPDTLDIISLDVHGALQDEGKAFSVTITDEIEKKYSFEPAEFLGLEVLNYRYYSVQDDEVYYANENSLDMMRSYISRMFPVATVDWRTRIIDAPSGFSPPFINYPNTLPDLVWQRKLNLLHAHTSMVRLIELEYFNDELFEPERVETAFSSKFSKQFKEFFCRRYYGIVNDPENEFEGAASFVPEHDKHNGRNGIPSRPDCVAAGIAEEYSGYYGAHEIAHTLGSLHHGVGDGQEEENQKYKQIYYEQGKISTKSMQHIGLDYGDSKFPKKILKWNETFDIMSYEDNLWISSYTYKEILAALKNDKNSLGIIEEKELSEEKGLPEKKYVSVIGSYDFTERTGKFLYVHPTKQQALSRDFSKGNEDRGDRFNKVVLIARYGGGNAYDPLLYRAEVKIQIKRQDHTDLPQATGMFHTTVNRFYTEPGNDTKFLDSKGRSKELKSIELYVDESKPVVYRFLLKEDVKRQLLFEPLPNFRADKKFFRIGVKSGPEKKLDYFLIFYFKDLTVEERRYAVPILDYRNYKNIEKEIDNKIKKR